MFIFAHLRFVDLTVELKDVFFEERMTMLVPERSSMLKRNSKTFRD